MSLRQADAAGIAAAKDLLAEPLLPVKADAQAARAGWVSVDCWDLMGFIVIQWDIVGIYPLIHTKSDGNGPCVIDLPIFLMLIFHSYGHI